MLTHLSIVLLNTLGMMLGVLTQAAGHVDLYQDAYFKHKITRVRNVQTDTCYNLACSIADNVITSAKWSGLPETGVAFEGGGNLILFYTARGCQSGFKAWPVMTQSHNDSFFPENFRLDGINDAISSFLVTNAWEIKRSKNVCNEAEYLDDSTGSEGSNAVVNNTMEYL